MTEEISIRASRSERGANEEDVPAESGTAGQAARLGESAWNLDHPAASETTGKRAQENAEAAAPFPPFPGLEDIDQEPPPGRGLDIKRYIRGIWKRRWLVAAIALLSIFLSVLVALTLERKWEAAAVLLLRTHQDEFALGSSTPFKPQEFNLKTLLDTVKLPSTLDAVMEATNVSVMRRTLAAAINVTLGKDSNIFQVKAIWDDPDTAAAIANEVASFLITSSSTLRRKDAEEAYQYYLQQLDDVRIKRRSISEEMRKFQSDRRVSDFTTEIKVLIEELAQLETQHNTKVAEIEATQVAQKRLQELIEEQPEMVVISTIYRNPLKQRLSDYEWQLQEALSRYTEKNPKVIKLQEKISVLEKMIDDSSDEGAPQNTFAPNNQRSEMQTRLQKMTDDLKVMEAQAEALQQTIRAMRDNLAHLSSSKKEYEQIRSRLEGTETLESNLISRVDEARVIMLRNEASFKLVEAAHPPQEPLPSGRKLLLAAGTILGSGGGLFLALMLEFFDPRVRSRRDVMDLTGVELAWEFQRVPDGEKAVIDADLPSGPLAILFRRWLNEMDVRLEEEQWRCLAIASVEPLAGRTLVATNLAQALALKEREVVLIDADLRRTAGERPSRFLDIDAKHEGLWEALRGGAAVGDLLTATTLHGLHLLGPGEPPVPPDGAVDASLVALGDQQLKRVIAALEAPNRHLLFDLPPLSSLETSVEAAMAIGNLILVARSGQTSRSELRETTQMLAERGVTVHGVVLTDVPEELLSGKPTFRSSTNTRSGRWRSFRRQSNNA